MPDVKKVIEALEACVLKDPDDSRDCRHCPRCNYGAFITTSCINGVMADALALLKAQEPVEPIKHYVPDGKRRSTAWQCRNCLIDIGYGTNYCYNCGQAVKWG